MRRLALGIWIPFVAGMSLFGWLMFGPAQGGGQAKTGPAAGGQSYLPQISRDFAWDLAAINGYRAQADLPILAANPDWSAGAAGHARYMVKTDQLVGREDRVAFPQWYSDEGNQAASNSLLLVTDTVAFTENLAADFWIRSPFQALSVLDPELRSTGLGTYAEADGGIQMAAVLNVASGWQAGAPAGVTYPVVWPGRDAVVAQRSYSGADNPDPHLAPGCAGAQGLPLIVQFGDGTYQGERLAAVNPTIISSAGGPLPHCAFSATEYPANAADGNYGKLLLDTRDAVVLMPFAPLAAGQTYTVGVTALINSAPVSVTWTFRVDANAAP